MFLGPRAFVLPRRTPHVCPGPSPVQTLSPSEDPKLDQGNVSQQRKATFQSVSSCCSWAGLTSTVFGYMGGSSHSGGVTECEIMEVTEQE